jgi:hypothetical protein
MWLINQSICLNIPHPPPKKKQVCKWNEFKKMPIKVSNMSLWKLPAREQATTYLNPWVKMTHTPKLTHHTNWSKVLSKISTVDFPPSFPDSLTKSQIPNPSTSRQMNPITTEQNKKTLALGILAFLNFCPLPLHLESFHSMACTHHQLSWLGF